VVERLNPFGILVTKEYEPLVTTAKSTGQNPNFYKNPIIKKIDEIILVMNLD